MDGRSVRGNRSDGPVKRETGEEKNLHPMVEALIERIEFHVAERDWFSAGNLARWMTEGVR